MNQSHAEMILELLTNAGWMDDADELLGYILESDGKIAALDKAQQVDDLIAMINPFLPDVEKVSGRTCVETLNLIM